MTTKEKVLQLLKDNTGIHISGQDMADQLFVTRASVWKAIKALQNDGYEIEAVTNKGYRLVVSLGSIDTAAMAGELADQGIDMHVFYMDEVDSTNDHVRRLAADYDGNILLLAGAQTMGRGRRGRSFFSPKNTGLYMSILLRTGDDLNIQNITGITAVATATAIDSIIYEDVDTTKIKWVNDIFLKDKKVCGILSEAYSSLEDESDNYIIIGMGINIFAPKEGFPKDIKKTAGALISGHSSFKLEDIAFLRSRLATSIIINLKHYINHTDESIDIYRNKSNLIGNFVKINTFKPFNKKDKKDSYAKVVGINDSYHLIIEYDNGSQDELSSGEVSVVRY